MFSSYSEFIKTVIGVILIVLGIVAGLYIGGYLCLVMGIVNIITGTVNLANGVNVDAMTFQITFGVIKVIFSGVIGWGIFAICGGIGAALLE